MPGVFAHAVGSTSSSSRRSSVKRDLFADVRSDPDLERRLRTSLETCGLMLKALAARAR